MPQTIRAHHRSHFRFSDQQAIRSRVSKAFRFIISQRLIPRKDGTGRVAVIEILKSTMRTREYVEKGEGEGKTLLDAMRDGGTRACSTLTANWTA